MFFTFAKKIQTFQEYFGFEDDLHLFWFGLIQILLIFWETKYTNPKDLILFIKIRNFLHFISLIQILI
jgi:hypothetical protein